MPRYYFPSWDGDSFVPDEVGVDVGGVEEACALATLALAEMARDILPGSFSERVLKMLVTDSEDKPVLELRLTFEVVRDT